ncbi:hypothetical protein [Microbacterium yannicii]|uniref:hypothetical protein n=1 Tax=Microbacterium yannicii TaxID=671622 RepID=UPI00030B3387|nr:hypothetical protein [Microbacterium yannicii]
MLQEHGAVIGEEAHVRSSRPDGPRHDPEYPSEKLDTYDNLILLCPTHHTTIDKESGAAWSIEELQRMKADHERAIDAMTGAADLVTRDIQEVLAAQVALWERLAHVDEWQKLTACLNQVHPFIRKDVADDLFTLSTWLLQRRWPSGYERIVAAFEQFGNVLGCLLQLVGRNFEPREELLELPRGHKRIDWNPSLYTELLTDFNVKANVIWLLTMELTRAANLLITAVASELDPLYRMAEGYVLMQDGDAIFGSSVSRLEYAPTDIRSLPRPYSLAALMQRTAKELGGGDPRRERDVDHYAVNVAEWSEHTLET